MEEKKRLPDAELAVMQAVWAQSGEVGRADIEGALTSQGWSANTLNTYLTRLCEKGFLTSRREGRNNLYTPLVSAARAARDRRAAAVSGRYEPLTDRRSKKGGSPWNSFC